MTDLDNDGRCGSCAAFSRVRPHAEHGRIGECSLEVYAPPILPHNSCSRYRPKGALAAAVRPRAAGEPRRGGGGGGGLSSGPISPAVIHRPLPQQIDIDMDINEFRRVLRQVLNEELGVSDVPMGSRWRGGTLTLQPGNDGTQAKTIPLDSFFHKIVMVRNKLRVLEAKVNGNSALSDQEKVQLQSYITGCYGSLTTFNVLFANKDDGFRSKR